MPEYRRPWVPGATYFVTIVTYRRQSRFVDDATAQLWRGALSDASKQKPFKVVAGVILPDHLHLILELPPGIDDLSSRLGLAKANFTKTLGAATSNSKSRAKHREADVWQRRFFDHMIRDEQDFISHMDYVHYNPVKHGHAECPKDWKWSSFKHWVERGAYTLEWACKRTGEPPNFTAIKDSVGE